MFTVEANGFMEEFSFNNDVLGKIINKLSPDDKLEILSHIDFDTDKIEDLRLLLRQSLNLLLEFDLTPSEVSILHSTLSQSTIKLIKKYKNMDK